jgi:hypothetical protein
MLNVTKSILLNAICSGRQSERDGLDKAVFVEQLDGIWFIYQVVNGKHLELGMLTSEASARAVATEWLGLLFAVAEDGVPLI